jgi:type IV secretion system protein VirD4
MMRAAARDPLWAFLTLIAMPFRIWKRLLGFFFILIIVTFVIGMGGRHFLEQMGFGRGSVVFFIPDLVTLLALAAITFRLITNALILHFGDSDCETHGSARFATDKEIAALTSSGSGLLIGRDTKSGKPLRYDGPAHLLTMAPTRTGKGVGTIIPNLLTADRSVICVDPKGENARITGRARQKFGPVHVLDPFGVTGRPSATFNPLAMLDPLSLDVAEDASTLADALVFDEPGMAGEAHWNEEAKALIAGLLLKIVAAEPLRRRHLATLRDYLTLAPEHFAALLKRMQESDAARGLVARAANRHLGKSDREAAGVLSAAQRHTHFLDSPRMTAVLSRSDFRFADLKRSNVTVFLVLPPDRLSTYSRWLRLLVSQSLLEMARDRTKPTTPVLYLLDEFASLGHLAPVERAMGLMAGYGVQLWPILQDIHQLRATYGHRAGTFLSNAGVLQVFGVNDHDSARLISDLLGQETVVFQTMARALDSDKTGISYSQQHTGRPLLTPDEVRNLPAHGQLLFLAGQRPIFAEKLAYFTDPEFREMFDPV